MVEAVARLAPHILYSQVRIVRSGLENASDSGSTPLISTMKHSTAAGHRTSYPERQSPRCYGVCRVFLCGDVTASTGV